MGRFRAVIGLTPALLDEFARLETTLDSMQTLIWLALAHAGLHNYDAALHTLDQAATLIGSDRNLTSHRMTLAVSRAHLLLETGRAAEARVLLEVAIPTLRQAGLAIDAVAAQVSLGAALL